MCDKVVSTYLSTIKFVLECFLTQEIFFWRYFLIVYCHGKYKFQRMGNKAADDSLAALKLIPDWFVTS